MSDPVVPPIPALLQDAPRVGGLAVPYVTTFDAAGQPHLGLANHGLQQECLLAGRCPICGQRLTSPMTLLVPEHTLEHRYSPLPPMHPDCARYSAAACPVLAGRLHQRRTRPRRIAVDADYRLFPGEEWTDPPARGYRAAEAGVRYILRPAEPGADTPLPRIWAVTVPDIDLDLHGSTGDLVAAYSQPLDVRPADQLHTGEPAT